MNDATYRRRRPGRGVLHVSRAATVAPQHVIDAHREAAGPWFDCATSATTLRDLTELSAADTSATAADVLELLWADLVGMQD
jgi:hypothetical protein